MRRLCRSELELDIFELADVAGKAATDQEVEACILTKETAKGGELINQIRVKNGLKGVTPVYIDLIY